MALQLRARTDAEAQEREELKRWVLAANQVDEDEQIAILRAKAHQVRQRAGQGGGQRRQLTWHVHRGCARGASEGALG